MWKKYVVHTERETFQSGLSPMTFVEYLDHLKKGYNLNPADVVAVEER